MSERSISNMWSEFPKVTAFITANVGGVALNSMVAKADQILHLLVSAGQVAVAAVTVWYIVKKIRNLPSRKKQDEKKA